MYNDVYADDDDDDDDYDVKCGRPIIMPIE